MGRKGFSEEAPQGLPSWVTSFGDMTTNLLTFFVLLQSFAHTRDAALFYVGQGSFRRVIAGLGIPDLLLGKDDKAKNQFPRSFFIQKKSTPEVEDDPGRKRVVNPEDDAIRQSFEELARQMNAQTETVRQIRVSSGSPVLQFAPRSVELSSSANLKLVEFVHDLKELPASHACVYVMAIAPDISDVNGQWVLSACRAEVVRKALREAMATEGLTGWRVQAWGAPRAGEWARQKFGITGENACAGLAVAETE